MTVLVCAGMGLGAAGAWAQAPSGQAYPAKTVRVLVPWPPGGGNDLLARPIAQKLTENLKQSFVVDNRGGANSIIGSEVVARAPADGYTVMINSVSSMTINPVYYAKLPFSLDNFAAVTRLTWWTHALTAHPTLPVKNMRELIALAKARPNELAYASFGTASTSHLGGELLNAMAGIKLTHVPYKGGGPALTDTLGGQVPLYFTTLPPAVPYIQSGKLRALAVTSARRSQYFPEVPTFGETPALKDFVLDIHYGLWVPAGTPREVIARLNAEVGRALQAPEVRERLKSLGAEEIAGSTPEQLDALMKAETPLWGRVLKAAGIKTEEFR
ncbi:MAG: Bug family tripartite tricarboxylate transporter substrate binding protein [Burkholderiales bacterium]